MRRADPAAQRELRGEDVSERVRRDPLALGDAGRVDIAEKCLRQDRLRQPTAVHADEERLLGVVRAYAEVVTKSGSSAGWIPACRLNQCWRRGNAPRRKHCSVRNPALGLADERARAVFRRSDRFG
jgi:hypothetical protein